MNIPALQRLLATRLSQRIKDMIASVLVEEDAYAADEQVELGVVREFTHVATPEENSYIEAFHSIVQIEVVDRLEFESFHHAKMVFYRYYEWYNYEWKHGSLGKIYPEEFLKTRA